MSKTHLRLIHSTMFNKLPAESPKRFPFNFNVTRFLSGLKVLGDIDDI